jgi:hypothetical protein
MSISKIKIVIFGFASVGLFVLGRETAPKPKPEIKIIDNSKSIEKAIADTQEQMILNFHKQIIRETHTFKSKTGIIQSDIKEKITYQKNSVENTNQKIKREIQTSNIVTTQVKQTSVGIDYTFMVGRSFSNPHYDYFASIGVPLFAGIKLNGGYEIQDKKIFLGATLNF